MNGHEEKINELVETLSASIRMSAKRLVRSGGIDAGKYNAAEYVLAKIAVTAAARQHKDDFAPPFGLHKKELSNLARF